MDVLFSEKQYFYRNPIFYLLSAIWLVLLGFMLYRLIVNFNSFNLVFVGFLLCFVVILGVAWYTLRFLSKIILKTEVDESGIYFRMAPFHKIESQVLWSQIDQYFIGPYNPLSGFKLWGLKKIERGLSMTIAGNKALFIFLKDGRKLVLGTQKEKELFQLLQKMQKVR